jgi:hypothetical protein
LLKEAAAARRYGESMKFGANEILIIGLGMVVLTLIALWAREEIIDWRATRHHRREDRRAKTRGRRRYD